MKTTYIRTCFLPFLFLIIDPSGLAAQCTNCQNTISYHGSASSAIGVDTKATGLASFASGYKSQALGHKSATIGSMTTASGEHAMVFGVNANASGKNSFVIGQGYGNQNEERLVNSRDHSLMIGFNSIYPTLFIGPSLSKYQTGRVGIGNIAVPQAKLHLRCDPGETSGMLIDQPDFSKVDLFLGNTFHGVCSHAGKGLIFKTRNHYLFNEGRIGIGTSKPTHDLDVRGSLYSEEFTLFNKNVYPENIAGFVLRSDEHGKAYWTDPSFLADDDWETDGRNVYRLSGSVGIGTSDTYGYKLAVKGAIITEEITVKVGGIWPDYVFDKDYELLPLAELEQYILKNKHLPEMPAADHVYSQGIGLGHMQKLLLKKIEELTLHLIRQEEKIALLEKRLTSPY